MRRAFRSLLVLAVGALSLAAGPRTPSRATPWITGHVRDGGHRPNAPWAGMFVGLRMADVGDCSGPGPHTWSAADGSFALPRWTPPPGGGAATTDVAVCLGWVRGDSTDLIYPVLRLPASSPALRLDCVLHDASGRPGCEIVRDSVRRTKASRRAG